MEREGGTETAAASVARRRQFEREALPHLEALRRYALRLTSGDEAWADDVLQDALLKAYRSWHTYQPGTNCRAWLKTIVRHALVNHCRRKRPRRLHVDVDRLADHTVFRYVQDGDPEGRFFSRMLDGEVVCAIAALSPKHREAVLLRDLQDLTYAEMARRLSVPEGTVKSRLHRGRRELQRRLYGYALRAGYIEPREGRWESCAA